MGIILLLISSSVKITPFTMEDSRKKIYDVFQERLCQNYINYCEFHNAEENLDGLITYLIDQELISNVAIKRYTIKKEFEELYPLNKHHKTQTVHTLASKFNISTRSVWSILKREKNKE